jgi:hypothetical protein
MCTRHTRPPAAGGKLYARAMSVWSMLPACRGFVYRAPAGLTGFKPVWKPEDHVSFCTAAEGWGLFRQRRQGNQQSSGSRSAAGSCASRRWSSSCPRGPS